MESFISSALRYGVLASAAVIALGYVLLAATARTGYPPGTFPTGLTSVLRGVAALKPGAIIGLGLVMLIATPVFRVGSSIVAFALERDNLYVMITTFVFIVLMVSFFLGRAGG